MNPPESRLDRRSFFRPAGVSLATAGLLGGAVTAGGESAGGSSGDVKLSGAKGDGVTDDTAPIQAALDAAGKAGGGVVFLPPGVYKTTATLRCTFNNVALCGAGGASVLKPAGDFDTLRFNGPGPTHIY